MGKPRPVPEVVIDIPDDMPSLAQNVPLPPQDEVRAALARIPFSAPPGPQRQAQQALENRYIDWVATNVVEPRRKAFGEGKYRLANDLPAIGADAALPAAYQFVRQFLSSSSRSSVTGSLTAALKFESVLVQPLATGGMNALRRTEHASDKSLTEPSQIFLNSIWASGVAGGASKALFEVLKGLPWLSQPDVDDFMGGRQRVNLFALHTHDAASPPATWSDIAGLPRFMAEAFRENLNLLGSSLGLGGQPALEAFFQVLDIGFRHAFSNVMSNVAASEVGRLLAQIRRGGSDNALPGESCARTPIDCSSSARVRPAT